VHGESQQPVCDLKDVPAQMHFYPYYGKIRRIMLHKPEIAGQFTCVASESCDASVSRAFHPCHERSMWSLFSTPHASVNHHVAVIEELFINIVALLPILWQQNRSLS
jgi:hypothetical protein